MDNLVGLLEGRVILFVLLGCLIVTGIVGVIGVCCHLCERLLDRWIARLLMAHRAGRLEAVKDQQAAFQTHSVVYADGQCVLVNMATKEILPLEAGDTLMLVDYERWLTLTGEGARGGIV